MYFLVNMEILEPAMLARVICCSDENMMEFMHWRDVSCPGVQAGDFVG